MFYDWLVVDLPLWKMMEFVSWDDDIPNIWKIKHVPNHQSDDGLWCFMGFPLVYVSLHRYLWSIDIGQLAPLLERWNPQSGCPIWVAAKQHIVPLEQGACF